MNIKAGLDKKVICLMILYLVVCAAGIVMNLRQGNVQGAKMGVVALFTPWIVPVIFRLFSLHMTTEVWIIDLVFVFFASVIGSCFGGYGLPFFDKVLHFSSGFLAASAGAVIYMRLAGEPRKQSKNMHVLFLLFVFFSNLAVAVLWEFFEYFMLVAFQNDCIHHYDSGVHDSMTDMLCAFCAGLFVIGQLVRWLKNGKKGFFVNLCERFYLENRQKEE